jgi:3-hydroxyisobutyrate dehydrogenase
MKIGYAGKGPLAATAVQRLTKSHEVVVFAFHPDPALLESGAKLTTNVEELSRDCDAILLSLESQAAIGEMLLGSQGIAKVPGRRKIVIDMTAGDPDEARALSGDLDKLGVTLLDAPIHCERSEELSEVAAIMCGGPANVVESMRPVLETICPNVVYCGESGNGHAAKLVVAAVAACNRLITYECACVGIKAGLATEHMAAVFNKSSGYNSATARVLPGLGVMNSSTTDVSLAASLEELKLASRLAMRCGAPFLIANHATSVAQAAASQFGDAATLDAIARLFEASSGIEFANRKTPGVAG